MKFLLIIMVSSNGFGGQGAIQVPMETIELCEAARTNYAENSSHGYTDVDFAKGKTICVQVKE